MLMARLGHNEGVNSLKTTWFTRTAMVLAVVGTTLALTATGNLGGASATGLRATEVALGRAAELADATAALAVALEKSVITLANGTGSTAEAMEHTVEVSTNVRRLLDAVSLLGLPSFTEVDDLSNSLELAEASLLEVQGGMNETQANLIAAGPELSQTVGTLEAVPGELRAAQAIIRETTQRLDRQVVLLRLVILFAALAMLLALVALERVASTARSSTAQP
jgi:hypothetical protein